MSLFKGYAYLASQWDPLSAYQSYLYNVWEGTCARLNMLEVFTSAVILELLHHTDLDEKIQQSLLTFIRSSTLDPCQFSLFCNSPNAIPPDVDTTAMCIAALSQYRMVDPKTLQTVAQSILDRTASDGTIELFFSSNPRWMGTQDHAICANALYVIYLAGFERKAKPIEDLVEQILVTNHFLKGSLYYFSPDVFLLLVARLVKKFPRISTRFRESLKDKLNLRIGTTSTPLDLSMRVLVSKILHVANSEEEKLLRKMQLSDGSWEEDFLYASGPHEEKWQGHFIGSKVLSTAFAIRACACETPLSRS